MSKKTKKIIVNLLSLSRVIGALLLPLIFLKVSIPALITLLVVLFVTDMLDGMLARKWEVKTIGGGLLDPLGDKMLAIMCIFSLWQEHTSFGYLLLGEVLITLINILRSIRGEKVKSLIIGKIKTWALSITLIIGAVIQFGLLNIDENILQISFYITIALEIMTILVYLLHLIVFVKKESKYSLKDIDIKYFLKRVFNEEKYKEDKDKSVMELLCMRK